MASITSWIRLEPGYRSSTMAPGLEARLHDPLWLLARQWQLGEYSGQDAGTPVSVRVRGETGDLGTSSPLSVSIEAEPRDVSMSHVRDGAETGQHLVRMLRAVQLTRAATFFVTQFPLAPMTDDRDAQALARRVPDGRAIAKAVAPLVDGGADLPPDFGLDTADLQPASKVLRAWLEWYRQSIVDSEAPHWDRSRFEYAYATSVAFSDRDVAVGAAEYLGDGLDWHSFDVQSTSSAQREPASFVRTVHTARATYRGMPAQRYWELEDAAVDFGAVDAPAGDIARMLLVEFALVYGGDWRVAPLTVPVGSLCRVRSVVVTDTFGERALIPPYHAQPGSESWRMFALSGGVELLAVPGGVGMLEGDAVEQVDLVRDEGTNLVWGIERRLESELGAAIEPGQAIVPPAAPRPGLVYQLRRDPAPGWIPFKAFNDQALLAPAAFSILGDVLIPAAALGEILRTDEIHDEEVPAEGVRIERHYRHGRWFDGQQLLWIAHRKRVGGNTQPASLQWDIVTREGSSS